MNFWMKLKIVHYLINRVYLVAHKYGARKKHQILLAKKFILSFTPTVQGLK